MADVTKLWIASKMKKLMERKPISKIRVSEICRLAEIERSTFYYHFKDKYDLVAWIFYYSAENMDVIDPAAAAAHLQAMKDDIRFYKNAYEDTSQNALWEYMNEYFADSYLKAAREKLHTDNLDQQLSYSIRLYCYGAVRMSREWILSDSELSATDAISMMFASMPQPMQDIYFSRN